MSADLHLHTRFSDGTYTPEELVGHARTHRLAAIALTDHDTVEGCARAASACNQQGLDFVSGTELTAELDGHELHILGYGIDTSHPALLRALAVFQQGRQDRIREMVARLNQRGIALEEEAVFALANCRAPGRPHVARALVQAGFCQSLDEAFDRFLKKHRPAWVPKTRTSATEAIQLLHDAGGLAVMAHPGLNRNDHWIPLLVEAGLDGIECWHSKHSEATTTHYLAIAGDHHLLVTGGSDCHGQNKGQPLIGGVRLAWEHFERLQQALASRRAGTAAPAPPPPS